MRISASRRGLRAGIGPRAARVHVGGGRPSISSGAGPVTVWHTMGGSKRKTTRRRTVPSRTSVAAVQRQARAAQREQDIQNIEVLERRLVTAHLGTFPSPSPPEVITPASLRSELTVQALTGLHWWQRKERTAARQKAGADAEQQAARQTRAWADYYARLQQNDPETIMAALEEVFEDNEHPAAPIDCADGVVTITIMFDPASSVPDLAPAVTPGGKRTLHKRTESDRQQLYARALGSTVLATVKEAYSTGQWLRDVKILVICKDPDAASPRGVLTAIYAGHFPVARMSHLDWAKVDPVEQLLVAPGALLVRSGSAKRISPLPLEDQPDLRLVVDQLRQSLGSTNS